MKKKTLIFFLFFVLPALGAALWQALQAGRLEDELQRIDRKTQAARLLELSLPRVQAEMGKLLADERKKLGDAPPIGLVNIPMPAEGKADFNCGFFLLTPANLQTFAGDEDFARRLADAPILTNTIRRKAYNPSAPIVDPGEKSHYDPHTQLPLFSVYEITETDLDAPMHRTGAPGPFFAWHYKDNLIYMRSIPTTHGAAADGFVIDSSKLAQHLLPLVEPGLPNAEITFANKGEAPNLSPLPLVLRPGDNVQLPDTAERRRALRGPVISAWLISILTIAGMFTLLTFYSRVEQRRADFVSSVTHELRTPLTSFQLYTEMLQDPNLSEEKREEYHDILHRESLRLGHLVENVLAFARLTRGKVRGRCDVGACAQLISPLLEKSAKHLRKAGFVVHVNLDKRTELLRLRTDLVSVEQILLNLADNAIKYAEAEHPAVTINVLQRHRSLVLRFSDNGPGIAPDLRRRLFRPFSRAEQSQDARKPGVGLGLALSRDLARSIGGDLTAEFGAKKGSSFLLTLPLGE